MATLKTTLVMLSYMLRRRFHHWQDRRALRQWYRDRDLLRRENQAAMRIALIGFLLLFVVIVWAV